MPTPYHYLPYGDLRSPGVMELCNGPLGLRDDDDDDGHQMLRFHLRLSQKDGKFGDLRIHLHARILIWH